MSTSGLETLPVKTASLIVDVYRIVDDFRNDTDIARVNAQPVKT
jgi:hypothetical protein